MKKRFFIVLMAFILLSLAACAAEDSKDGGSLPDDATQSASAAQMQPAEEASKMANAEPAPSADGIDVDLTALSSTMVYSEVYNMLYTPDSYIGKTVKMQGQFAYYEDPETKEQYFACIIADATACCSQGMEFVLNGEYTYPDDYPELGEEITVTGTFEVYGENEFKFCRLVDATLLN